LIEHSYYLTIGAEQVLFSSKGDANGNCESYLRLHIYSGPTHADPNRLTLQWIEVLLSNTRC